MPVLQDDAQKLLYLRQVCPVLAGAGEDTALDAKGVGLTQQMGDPVLPPSIILEMIQLMSSLMGFLLNGCKEVPPNPTPVQIQKFMTERPTFGMRAMMIRRAARREWRSQGLEPNRVGISVEKKCRLMTGPSGLRSIQTAMIESKKMSKMFIGDSPKLFTLAGEDPKFAVASLEPDTDEFEAPKTGGQP